MGSLSKCSVHAERDAGYTCAVCRTSICDECVHTRNDGSIVCAGCLAPLESLDPVDPNAGLYDLGNSPAAPAAQVRPVVSILGKCKAHPEVHAVALCTHCTAAICATCDFAFPGGIHLCPACATNPKQAITPRRKAQSMWSLGLGIFNVVGIIVLRAIAASMAGNGGLDQGTRAAFSCFGLLIIVLAIIGLALGLSAFNRRSHNPGYLWAGPILNGIMVAFFLFNIIAAAVMQH